MSTPSQSNLRAFVRRYTRLEGVPDVPDVRLHLGDDIMRIMALAGHELGQSDPPLPFWAFAWAGGLAIARYIVDHPNEVAGRQVVDVATGSGLCAITAMRAGAESVHAFDIDPLSAAAVALNAKANGVRVSVGLHDVLDAPPPACDVVLAGDVCYEETMSGRMLDWLQQACRAGARVLIGDPGRAYLPGNLVRLADYRVRTSRELENADFRSSQVLTFPALSASAPVFRENRVAGGPSLAALDGS